MGKGKKRRRPDRPAMTPDRLMKRFDAEVNADGSDRVMRIDIDRYQVMTVKAKVAGRLWIRSKVVNDGWGWDSILKDWRHYRECYDMNRRAS